MVIDISVLFKITYVWHIITLIDISLKCLSKGPINNILGVVYIMTWHWLGDKRLYRPMMVRLPTDICNTRPQWVDRISQKSIQWLFSLHVCTPEKDAAFITIFVNTINTENELVDHLSFAHSLIDATSGCQRACNEVIADIDKNSNYTK